MHTVCTYQHQFIIVLSITVLNIIMDRPCTNMVLYILMSKPEYILMFEPSITVYHLHYIRLCWSYISQHIFIHWKCRFSLYHILFILNLPLFSFCVRSTCLLCVIYIRYVMMWEIQWKYMYTGVCLQIGTIISFLFLS